MGKGTLVPMPPDAPAIGEVFRHYKGDLYKVTGVALNSYNQQAGTDEWIVVYEPIYKNPAAPLFTRPLLEWLELVDWEGEKVQRFTKE